MIEDQPDAEHPRKRPTSDYVGFALIAALVIGLFSAPIYAVVKSRSGHDDPRMTMGNIGGTPVELATLPPAIAKLYRSARTHASHFTELPCYCGCQEGRLKHRNLFDCYVLADGRGWESHATGCDVCQGEAEMALDLLARGTPAAEVRTQIVDEYGTPQEIRDLREG